MTHGEWKPVEGWPYDVSNLGYVRPQVRRFRIRGAILKPYTDRRGYQRVTLYHPDSLPKTFGVHTLVCLAFIGPLPSSQHGVAHWDGNPANNAWTNLRWATMRENLEDCVRHGTRQFGETHAGVKISEKDVAEIVRLSSSGMTQRKIAERFDITQSNVSVILNGKSWKHLQPKDPHHG